MHLTATMEDLVESSDLRDVDARHFEPPPVGDDAGTIRRILVCIDRSAFSEGCLGQAIAISKSLGSAITLLHVMQPPHERSGPQTTNVLDWEICAARSDRVPRATREGGDGGVRPPGGDQARARSPRRAHHGGGARARRGSHGPREPWRTRRRGVEPGQHRPAGPGGGARLGARRACEPARAPSMVPEADPRAARRVAPDRERPAHRRANRQRTRRRAAARLRRPRAGRDRGAARAGGPRARARARRASRDRRRGLPGGASRPAGPRGGLRAHARPPKHGREAVAPRPLQEERSDLDRAVRARLHLQPGADVRERHGPPSHALGRIPPRSPGSPPTPSSADRRATERAPPLRAPATRRRI